MATVWIECIPGFDPRKLQAMAVAGLFNGGTPMPAELSPWAPASTVDINFGSCPVNLCYIRNLPFVRAADICPQDRPMRDVVAITFDVLDQLTTPDPAVLIP